jgi:hypothetical protein
MVPAYGLSDSLNNLVRAVLRLVNQIRQTRTDLVSRELILHRRPDLSLHWSAVESMTYPGHSQVTVVREHPELHRVVWDSIEGLPEYKALEEHLRANHPDSLGFLTRGISKLASLGVSLNAEAEYQDAVSHWLKQLTGKPIRRHAKIYLSGIVLEGSPFHIGEDFLLRVPVEEDFIEEQLGDALSWPKPRTSFSCIGELTAETCWAGQFQRLIEELATILLAFETGSVRTLRVQETSLGLDPLDGGTLYSGEQGERFKYRVSSKTVCDLGRARTEWASLLPARYDSADALLAAAMDRYRAAVLDQGSNQSAVFSAISCLEALLSDSSAELKYRLSSRVGALMRADGYSGVRVQKTVKAAYDIRSKFAHGDLKPKHEDEARRVAPVIVGIARVCVIRVAQLLRTRDKANVIQLIDEAQLDNLRCDELRDAVATAWIPLPQPGSALADFRDRP